MYDIKFNLKNIRKVKGVSQSELARRTGFSQSYVSQLSRKVKSPTLDVVCTLANALGVHPYDLQEIIENNKKSIYF